MSKSLSKLRNKQVTAESNGKPSKPSSSLVPARLVSDLRKLIDQSRRFVASAVNAGLAGLCWKIGQRIHSEVLKNKRAEYGERIVSTLSRQLTSEFGPGYSAKSLRHMIKFYEAYPDEQIVSALSRQLGWSHFQSLIYVDDDLAREFYAEMCRVKRWSVRTLRAKIRGMLFERTAISKRPEKLARQELAKLRDEDQLTPDLVFRDPYVLNFLQLKDTYSDGDLEAAILRELESFILEMGAGFAFVARQLRIQVDGEDYYLDLLFYHRKLRRLVALDLKLGKFEASHKGQMELYLRWLEVNEVQPGEEPPLGPILCAGKSDEHVELLKLDASGIRVASYLTELPPRELLKQKLHDAVRLARERPRMTEPSDD
jgi:predicted nuclease of restriction endonuclease-like (RecB) superfamily